MAEVFLAHPLGKSSKFDGHGDIVLRVCIIHDATISKQRIPKGYNL